MGAYPTLHCFQQMSLHFLSYANKLQAMTYALYLGKVMEDMPDGKYNHITENRTKFRLMHDILYDKVWFDVSRDESTC